jgi:hypothetical protein
VALRVSADASSGHQGSLQVLNWLYSEGERVTCGRPLLRYEEREGRSRDLRTLAAPRTGTLVRIDVNSGPIPLPDSPIGLLRAVAGAGVELGDRIEISRAIEADLMLGSRRAERELRAESSRVALWGIPAVAAFAYAGYALVQSDPLSALLRALLGALLAGPALASLLRMWREARSERNAKKQLVELRSTMTGADVELARLWDDFRLLADRFASAVAAWEDGMPSDDLFTPGSEWSGNVRLPGTLVRLHSKDLSGDDPLGLDDRLFPAEFAAHLPAGRPASRGGLYRVIGTRTREGRLQAARWATYFPLGG